MKGNAIIRRLGQPQRDPAPEGRQGSGAVAAGPEPVLVREPGRAGQAQVQSLAGPGRSQHSAPDSGFLPQHADAVHQPGLSAAAPSGYAAAVVRAVLPGKLYRGPRHGHEKYGRRPCLLPAEIRSGSGWYRL